MFYRYEGGGGGVVIDSNSSTANMLAASAAEEEQDENGKAAFECGLLLVGDASNNDNSNNDDSNTNNNTASSPYSSGAATKDAMIVLGWVDVYSWPDMCLDTDPVRCYTIREYRTLVSPMMQQHGHYDDTVTGTGNNYGGGSEGDYNHHQHYRYDNDHSYDNDYDIVIPTGTTHIVVDCSMASSGGVSVSEETATVMALSAFGIVFVIIIVVVILSVVGSIVCCCCFCTGAAGCCCGNNSGGIHQGRGEGGEFKVEPSLPSPSPSEQPIGTASMPPSYSHSYAVDVDKQPVENGGAASIDIPMATPVPY